MMPKTPPKTSRLRAAGSHMREDKDMGPGTPDRCKAYAAPSTARNACDSAKTRELRETRPAPVPYLQGTGSQGLCPSGTGSEKEGTGLESWERLKVS
jgi:hypothetical protein